MSRTDKSRDAFVLVKLTNKFGFFSRGKFSTVRDKLKNNLLDAAYADWIQCKYMTDVDLLKISTCYTVGTVGKNVKSPEVAIKWQYTSLKAKL